MNAVTDETDERIRRMRERLQSAQPVKRRRDSVAADVGDLFEQIEAQRARGLTWVAIAELLYADQAKMIAVRSAFGRKARKSSAKGPTKSSSLRKANAPGKAAYASKPNADAVDAGERNQPVASSLQHEPCSDTNTSETIDFDFCQKLGDPFHEDRKSKRSR